MARSCHILIIALLFWAGVDDQVVSAALDCSWDDASISQDDEYLPSGHSTILEDIPPSQVSLPVGPHVGLPGRNRHALAVAARKAVQALILPSADPVMLLMSLQR
jgi:hypothetical protein